MTDKKEHVASPQTIYLKDYLPPAYLVERVELRVDIADECTEVSSSMQIRRNPQVAGEQLPLVLDGQALELVRIAINGTAIDNSNFHCDDEHLTLTPGMDQFALEITTRIRPQDNTALEGLYMSNGMYCTQCEAEGFRRITYYLDRPDVLSCFTTTIVADKTRFPVLLSNGNPVDQGELEDNRHWVRWEDPFPKPCYLFALVAGELVCIEDTFTTRSGRDISLQIFVEENNSDKCDHALQSLKQAMAWDEQTFNLEYDLDIYMIVAVDHFNMGAMENKGLNIFNSKYVLAKPETATDTDFINIQGVIGHEYFHNWTGNRVTCRDWFQLSLKEGLTVFRDQEFTSDMNSRAVKRIGDVRLLRSAQFPEDNGPMSHPIRPDSYIEINNFYTLTVYEKGAEVIRMIHTLLGADNFRRGMDLYFGRHDGQAVTTDDFVQAMEDASGIDLSHFRLWYSQSGTPVLTITDHYDAETHCYTLKIHQHTAPTAGQTDKKPLHIPLSIALLDQQGQEMTATLGSSNDSVCGTHLLHLHDNEEVIEYRDVGSQPVPSLLRGFSAPVKLDIDLKDSDLAFLMARDTDPFNRWEAGQQLATRVLLKLVADVRQQNGLALPDGFTRAVETVLTDPDIDLALQSEALLLPSESLLGESMETVDVDAIHSARQFVRRHLSEHLQAVFLQRYHDCTDDGEYDISPQSMARRRMRNLALAWLVENPTDDIYQLCLQHYHQAHNMTDAIGGLSSLVNIEGYDASEALDHFYDRWHADNLVIDKWFSIQAQCPREDTLQQVIALMEHPAFDIKTPNRVRSLIGVFCHTNTTRFHAADGSGYAFLGEQIMRLDELNPQVAARMVSPLTRWRRYDHQRQNLMREQLETILAIPSLSRDVFEITSKSLK